MFNIYVIQKAEEVMDRYLTAFPAPPPPAHLLGSKESVPNESPSFRRNETKERWAASDLRRFSNVSNCKGGICFEKSLTNYRSSV